MLLKIIFLFTALFISIFGLKTNIRKGHVLPSKIVFRVTTESAVNCTLVMASDFVSWPYSWMTFLRKRSYNYLVTLNLNSKDIFSGPVHWDPYTMVPGRVKPGNCLIHFVTVYNPQILNQLIIQLQKFIRVAAYDDFVVLWVRKKSTKNWFVESPAEFERLVGIDMEKSSESQMHVIRAKAVKRDQNYRVVPEEFDVNIKPMVPSFDILKLPFTRADGLTAYVSFIEDIPFDTLVNKVTEKGERSLSIPEAIFYNYHVYTGARIEVYESESKGSEVAEPRLPNGTWLGSTHDLITGKAAAVLVIFWSEGMNDFINMQYPIAELVESFVVPLPKRIETWFAFMWPYTKNMWLLIFLSVILTTVIAFLLHRLESAVYDRKLDANDFFRFLSFTSVSLVKINIDLKLPVKGHSVKLLIAFWFCVITVLTNGYQEMLLSYLTIPIYNPAPKSFDDLRIGNYLCYFDYRHAVIFKAFSARATGKNINYIRKNIRNAIDLKDCIVNAQEKGNSACMSLSILMDVAVNEFIDSNGKSTIFYTYGSGELSRFFGGAASKQVPYFNSQRSFHNNILVSGLLEKWKQNAEYDMFFHTLMKLKSTQNSFDNNSNGKVELLSVKHVCGIFVLYVICVIISFLCLLSEVLLQYFC